MNLNLIANVFFLLSTLIIIIYALFFQQSHPLLNILMSIFILLGSILKCKLFLKS
jgi:hypothetical protein